VTGRGKGPKPRKWGRRKKSTYFTENFFAYLLNTRKRGRFDEKEKVIERVGVKID